MNRHTLPSGHELWTLNILLTQERDRVLAEIAQTGADSSLKPFVAGIVRDLFNGKLPAESIATNAPRITGIVAMYGDKFFLAVTFSTDQGTRSVVFKGLGPLNGDAPVGTVVGASTLVISKDGRIALVVQSRCGEFLRSDSGKRGLTYELVRGCSKPGEAPDLTALRKAVEEAGAVCDDHPVLTKLGIHQYDGANMAQVEPVFALTGVTVTEDHQPSDRDIVCVMWVSAQRAWQLHSEGRLHSAALSALVWAVQRGLISGPEAHL